MLFKYHKMVHATNSSLNQIKKNMIFTDYCSICIPNISIINNSNLKFTICLSIYLASNK